MAPGVSAQRRLFFCGLAAWALSCGSAGSGGSGVLEEAARIEDSTSPDYWLTSGGLFFFGQGFGRTVQGELPPDDPWRVAYARSNPGDTDGGFHPQNVFRLLTRAAYRNASETLVFRIRRMNLSNSDDRGASNGVFLFVNYLDQNDLYDAGLRVDGSAAVKKKARGSYFTLARQPVFPGSYDRDRNPNLIPQDRDIELKSAARTNPDGTVTIDLFVDGAPVIEVTDDGKSFGGPVLSEGFAGIRTDFMDAEFRDYGVR